MRETRRFCQAEALLAGSEAPDGLLDRPLAGGFGERRPNFKAIFARARKNPGG
ncbi:MAG TPA: hypothetical protein VGV60_16760 [Candidatus Polarisedimenticolia bacterium]|nr:hypothetical protein [Candidatus Polarisedimenticolia bacterium]